MTAGDGQPGLPPFQLEVARMFFALPASRGFLLAGVEAPGPADVSGDDEVSEHESLPWGLGTGPLLALDHRAYLDGPAHPGDGDPRRERDRRGEVRRVVDVVAVELGPCLDGRALGD